MAPTEDRATLTPPVVGLSAGDVREAAALSDEAGWNQTAADWRLLLRLGDGFAVRDGGRAVATAVALPYPPSFGWISMVLVHGPYRRRGLATRLVEHAVASLDDRGLVPLLDATPAGEEVYARMGFHPVEALTRWRGQGGGDWSSAPTVDRAALRRLAGLDVAAFGADRSAVLDDLAARSGCICLIGGAGDGFLLSRRGRTATQLGPVVARDTQTALSLLDAGLAAVSGAVLVDLPDRAAAVAELAVRHGLKPERSFVRMALGRDSGFGDSALVHASAGPELG